MDELLIALRKLEAACEELESTAVSVDKEFVRVDYYFESSIDDRQFFSFDDSSGFLAHNPEVERLFGECSDSIEAAEAEAKKAKEAALAAFEHASESVTLCKKMIDKAS